MTEVKTNQNLVEKQIEKLNQEYSAALKTNKEFSFLKSIKNKLKSLKLQITKKRA